MCRDVDARDFGLGLLMMIKIRKINFSTIQYPPVIVCMGVCVCEGGEKHKVRFSCMYGNMQEKENYICGL